MKKIEQAGSDANQVPGKTSQTGNSVWTRSLKYQPSNEETLRQTPLRVDCEVYESPVRGLEFDREAIENLHQSSCPLVDFGAFKRVMVRHGAILTDEVA